MDGVLQVAALLLALGGAADAPQVGEAMPARSHVTAFGGELPPALSRPVPVPADSWTGEDKFRHFAASWAAMVFTYSAARAVQDDADTALAIALPVTGAFGIAKEVADQRRGGPFSFRDLTADALGAGVAWLFLREVH